MATRAEDMVKRNFVQWAVDLYSEAYEDYNMYDEYYNGEQPLLFSSARWESAFGNQFEDFEDNWCAVVVDALAQRLEIIGWRSSKKKYARLAEKIWDRENVGEEEEDITVQALIKGDSYAMVWPNPESVGEEKETQIFFNDALDVNVRYDPQNKRRILRGSKKWQTDEGWIRLNIYHPDRIVQFIASDERFLGPNPQELDLEPDDVPPDGWKTFAPPIPNPYKRVPIFHFKNRARGSTHGMSELKPVIPVQNAVNKVLMDMMLGSEFAGFPQKWMAGGGHPKDGWKAGPERVWATTDPNARFGQFDVMDTGHLREFVEMLVSHIAKITQTPMHMLRSMGDMPSGEALKTAESGLIHKARNRQKRWGHVWTQLMRLAIWMETGEKVPADVDLGPVWKFPETRHDLEQAQTAQLKSILGVPLRQLWSEHFGYTEEQIDDFEKDNKVIAAAALAQILSQDAQVPPGADISLGEMLGLGDADNINLKGMSIPQLLAQLSKTQTGTTTAGEATTNPQANTRPPASPTRRSSGFRD